MELSTIVRKEVRSLLKEGMQEYQALSFVAQNAMRLLMRRNIEFLKEYLSEPQDPQHALPMSVRFSELNLSENEQFSGTDVAALLSNIHGFIEFVYRPLNQRIQGDQSSEKHSGVIVRSRIRIYYTPKILHGLSAFGHLDEQRLFNFMWSERGATLVHELKHAVDEYRLGKHFNNDEEFKIKYKNSKPSPPDFKDEDDAEWMEYYRRYLNLPHEVWARFAEMVDRIEFKRQDNDIPYKHMPDGSPGIIYHMNTLEFVLRSLKKMNGWEMMDQKKQRRVINAMSSIWHEENEWVKDNNQKVQKA
jgi:hypothetical protein